MGIIKPNIFKQELLKGHGRCYLELKKEPDKYKEIILWACTHQISWDAQCEGTHSKYMYSLIQCYDDKSPFIEAMSQKFIKLNGNSWMFLYLSEVLNDFYVDGIKEIDFVFQTKYNELLDYLFKLKQMNEGVYYHQIDDLERLCLVICRNKNDFIRISNDIGRLIDVSHLFTGSDFEWFISEYSKKYEKVLLSKSKNNSNINRFLTEYLIFKEENEKRKDKISRVKSWDEKLKENAEDILKKYTSAVNDDEKIQSLKYFFGGPYNFDPTGLLNDVESRDDYLRYAALNVLSNIRHKKVRDWVKSKVEDDIYSLLPIYITNYQKSDLPVIFKLLKKVKFSFNGHGRWHDIVDSILNVNRVKPVPVELLLYVYENSYCGICKEAAFRAMKRRHLLTKEIIEECNFDANDDIHLNK